jgi:uncharacterized protein (TIGR00251 family)
MTELDFRETQDGIIIKVSVKPKAKREGVSGIHAGALKVSVNAPPDKGKANEAVISLLAAFFGVAKNMIELKSGAASGKKAFLIYGINTSVVMDALSRAGINRGGE